MYDTKDLSTKEVQLLNAPEVKETALPSKLNECVPGELCRPELFFEQIEKCKLCGKLL